MTNQKKQRSSVLNTIYELQQKQLRKMQIENQQKNRTLKLIYQLQQKKLNQSKKAGQRERIKAEKEYQKSEMRRIKEIKNQEKKRIKEQRESWIKAEKYRLKYMSNVIHSDYLDQLNTDEQFYNQKQQINQKNHHLLLPTPTSHITDETLLNQIKSGTLLEKSKQGKSKSKKVPVSELQKLKTKTQVLFKRIYRDDPDEKSVDSKVVPFKENQEISRARIKDNLQYEKDQAMIKSDDSLDQKQKMIKLARLATSRLRKDGDKTFCYGDLIRFMNEQKERKFI
jgi:hypothetical protein